jgi:hypothetical protein
VRPAVAKRTANANVRTRRQALRDFIGYCLLKDHRIKKSGVKNEGPGIWYRLCAGR